MNSTAIGRGFSTGPNLGFTDRQMRFLIGAGLIVTTLMVAPDPLGLWSIALLASIPVITTAIAGWDPVYAIMGTSTYASCEDDVQQRSWSCPNIGTMDRAVRAVIGITLIASLFAINTMHAEALMAFVGIPLVISAIIAWDPFYAMLGTNSFASRADVEVTEPEANEQVLSSCYDFPNITNKERKLARAA